MVRVFVLQSRSESVRARSLFRAIRTAVARAGRETITESSEELPSALAVLHALNQADMIICDVTGADPNVTYQLGYATARGKPTVLLSEELSTAPVDLVQHGILAYGSLPSEEEFTARLAEEVADVLAEPNRFATLGDPPDLLETAEAAPQNRRVFISYSHSDRVLLNRLLIHLRPLEREGRIDLWVDTRLLAGDRFRDEIASALRDAAIAVLMISADFLASEFIVNDELPTLLRNAEAEGTRILPVILKPCRFSRDDQLSPFQAINDPDRPMSALSEDEQEQVFDSVAETVERVLG